MTIIKIDRSTIKKNPNAGNTQTVVYGNAEVSFTIRGELPDHLVDGGNVIITEWSKNDCSGFLFNPNDIGLLKKIDGISYKINKNSQLIYHLPEPEYLFSYEDTQIPCNDCGNKVSIREIIEDENDDEDVYTICPHCKEIDTFHFKYESIYDIVKK